MEKCQDARQMARTLVPIIDHFTPCSRLTYIKVTSNNEKAWLCYICMKSLPHLVRTTHGFMSLCVLTKSILMECTVDFSRAFHHIYIRDAMC